MPKRKIYKNDSPLEDQECQELVKYLEGLEVMGVRFSHIAQSTRTPYWGVIIKNRKIGVVKGVPDYIIILPSRKTGLKVPKFGQRGEIEQVSSTKLLFIEMKRRKGSTVSQEQKDWIRDLNQADGVHAVICHGSDEAIQFINKELGI